MPQVVETNIKIKGFAQGTLAITSTAAQSAALPGGIYDIWTDADCFVKIATTADDVTTGAGYPLITGTVVPGFVLVQNDKIGGITASASSNLHWHRVG